MTEAHATIAAEIAADMADEAYFEAAERNAHPSELDLLEAEAYRTNRRFEDMLLAEVALNQACLRRRALRPAPLPSIPTNV